MLPVLPPSSSSSSSRVESWLAQIPPRDRLRLKRTRSQSPSTTPKNKTRRRLSLASACEVGRLDMAEIPKTPTPSAKGQARKRTKHHDGIEDDSAIHISASQVDSSSVMAKETQTNNTRNQRSALENHMMFYDKDIARERNKDFLNDVFDVLTGDRSSVTSQTTVKNVQRAQKENETAMENTYATAVFPILMGKSRTVPSPDILDVMAPTIRDFAQDRLHHEGPCFFVKHLIKGPSTKKEFGLTDPHPDLGFGIRKKEMEWNPPKVSDGTQNLIRAAGCLDHCFALSEVKGPDDPFAHAVTQLIRGGITLVRSKRELRLRAGYTPVKIGADPESWVFTIAWMHNYAEVFVCWHETQPEGDADHMHFLESYTLRKAEDIQRFRRDLHNILDWGLDSNRVAGLEQMVRDIAAKEAAENKAEK
ncbi:MAG: hypothetical protein Q9209_007708 [Squamulea sp. 1 TL-2023]